jgi:hypothetical protein
MEAMRLPLLVLAALIIQEPVRTPVGWSLKKSEKVKYEINHRLVTNKKDYTNEYELTLVVVIEGGDLGADRTNAYELTFERIALFRTVWGEREEYDSASDKEPPKSSEPRVLSRCVGKKVSGRISPSGNLGALDEIRKMVQAAVDAHPDIKGRWGADKIDRAARKLEWSLKLAFETPKGAPADVGDLWETKYDSRELTRGAGTAVCQSRLKAVRGGEADIEQTVKFDIAPPFAAGIKEAAGKGALVWDVERGRLKTLGLTAKILKAGGDVSLTVTAAQK